MTDKPATEAAPAAAATPKKQAARAKKPRVKPTHPPASEMVLAAIKSLKERGGSSLQAIKKYIATTYKVDVEKQSTFIKKYLKSAVEQKVLIQTKGKGASGSFKLSVAETKSSAKPKATKPKAVKKPASEKKAKTAATKKTATATKKAASPKKATIKKPAAKKAAVAAATKAAAPKKSVAKKTTKSPAAKPKTPKPKKTAAKKTAAKKK